MLAVGGAAVLFLHSVPAGGNDVLLETVCVAAGAAMGTLAALTTHPRRGGDGRALGRAGWLATPPRNPARRTIPRHPRGLRRRAAPAGLG